MINIINKKDLYFFKHFETFLIIKLIKNNHYYFVNDSVSYSSRLITFIIFVVIIVAVAIVSMILVLLVLHNKILLFPLFCIRQPNQIIGNAILLLSFNFLYLFNIIIFLLS